VGRPVGWEADIRSGQPHWARADARQQRRPSPSSNPRAKVSHSMGATRSEIIRRWSRSPMLPSRVLRNFDLTPTTSRRRSARRRPI